MKKLTLLLLLLIFSCDSTPKINDEVIATIKNEIQDWYGVPYEGKYYRGYAIGSEDFNYFGDKPTKVDKLKIVHISNNEFLGELNITTGGYSRDNLKRKVEVKIFYDGRSFIWEIVRYYQ